MDDFPGLLARDFGFRPQGKAAPMASSRGPANAGIGARGAATKSGGWNSTPSGGVGGGGSIFGDNDAFFGAKNQSTSQNYGDFDDIFGGPVRGATASASASSMPVYDKPVYDDDIFNGVPGMKSTGGEKYDDVFSSLSSSGTGRANDYDDLLGGFGRSDPEAKSSTGKRAGDREKEVSGFDDLIPGFGGSSPPQKRETSEANRPHTSTVPTKSSTNVSEDPFVVLESSVPVYSSSGLFNDPIEHLKNPRAKSTQAEGSGATGSIFDDFDAFEGLSLNSSRKDKNIKGGQYMSPSHATDGKEKIENPSLKGLENNARKRVPRSDYQDSSKSLFDMPTGFSNSHGSVGRSSSHPKDGIAHSFDTSPRENVSLKSDGSGETGDEAWLTVDEIHLFTQPTSAPPPSRPPPSLVKKTAQVKADRGSTASVYMKRDDTGSNSAKGDGVSSIDELENFAVGKPQNNVDEHGEAVSSEEDTEPNSAAAAAMKEAMDRAEAKFKHAREARERERDAKSARIQEFVRPEGDEKSMQDAQEQEYRVNQERLYHEQEQREMEEKEKEQKRLEKERERERIEKEKARQAVERATREARERSAAEARAKHERAAAERAAAEARERERAAVQRAAAEARERLAAEARERAEKVAAEARQKAAAEAREKERAAAEAREKAAAEARDKAVENAAAEVRARAERAKAEHERAAAAAEVRARAERAKAEHERAAAAAREKQRRNEDDLESFFGMGARPSSAPRQRSAAPDFQDFFDNQFQSKGSADAAQRTSSVAAFSIRKTSSATNIVDDLTSIFGGAPSAGEFQEVEGESEERRRARLERHQRTLERAAKALADKNERDMQTQREQAERHRIAETQDVEIKRWAAGKEGNLRALLSTLQYVLWPDCGWQPVSLTDLITAASVKKVYRKATLCIHPDKVQQKGANLQQKYIAEKVFDLLKEAWNKFNSEELF